MSVPSIELQGVTKRYGAGPLVLSDVSLGLQPNELVTVLGASGSGKTTILMIVAGFENPTSGSVFVQGRPTDGLPPQKRNLGIVFQSYALFPHLSVWQNIEFPLKVRGITRADRRTRVAKILEVVGLEPYGHRRPQQLSGGQQQRAALARALVFEPAALLLDEPLSALDRKLRESLQTEIKDVQQRTGASILYVTHDQEEALRLSDRIAVITEGRIAQVGTPYDVYKHPATLFVAGSLGETNRLPCTPLAVDAGSGKVRVRYAMGEGSVRCPPSNSIAPSSPGVVVVRPDDVVFCAVDEAPIHNRISGVIKEMSFLGSVVRYDVDIAEQAIVVRRPAGEMLSRDYRPGTAVTIGFNEDNGTFFPT